MVMSECIDFFLFVIQFDFLNFVIFVIKNQRVDVSNIVMRKKGSWKVQVWEGDCGWYCY